MKRVEFLGSSKKDLKKFPELACKEAGFQIWNVQIGEEPDEWKPITEVGPGVIEIIIDDGGNEFRVFYVAKFEKAVYVLHAFQKKTKKTRKHEVGFLLKNIK